MNKFLMFLSLSLPVVLSSCTGSDSQTAPTQPPGNLITTQQIYLGVDSTNVINVGVSNDDALALSSSALPTAHNIRLEHLPDGVTATYKNCAVVHAGNTCQITLTDARDSQPQTAAVSLTSDEGKTTPILLHVEYPQLSLSQLSVSQPHQEQAIYLQNTSNVPAIINNVTIGGSSAKMASSSWALNNINCKNGRKLMPGERCEFKITALGYTNTALQLAIDGTGLAPSSTQVTEELHTSVPVGSINFSSTPEPQTNSNDVVFPDQQGATASVVLDNNSAFDLPLTLSLSNPLFAGHTVSYSGDGCIGSNTDVTEVAAGKVCTATVTLTDKPSTVDYGRHSLLTLRLGNTEKQYNLLVPGKVVVLAETGASNYPDYQKVSIENLDHNKRPVSGVQVEIPQSLVGAVSNEAPIGSQETANNCPPSLAFGQSCYVWLKATDLGSLEMKTGAVTLDYALGGEAQSATVTATSQTYLYISYNGDVVKRYNGSTWETLGANSSVLPSNISTLIVGSDGDLYAGSQIRGTVWRYNGTDWTVLDPGYGAIEVNQLVNGPNHYLYAATQSGLKRIDLANPNASWELVGNNTDVVNRVTYDKSSGIFYALNNAGLWKIASSNGLYSWTTLPSSDLDELKIIASNGDLYIGGQFGLGVSNFRHYSAANNNWQDLPNPGFVFSFFLRSDAFYAGVGEELKKYENGSWQALGFLPTFGDITNLYVSKNQVVYAATSQMPGDGDIVTYDQGSLSQINNFAPANSFIMLNHLFMGGATLSLSTPSS